MSSEQEGAREKRVNINCPSICTDRLTSFQISRQRFPSSVSANLIDPPRFFSTVAYCIGRYQADINTAAHEYDGTVVQYSHVDCTTVHVLKA